MRKNMKTCLFILYVGIFPGLSVLSAQSSRSQLTKKEQDIGAIRSMLGCYEVSFNFIETFGYVQGADYEPSAEKHDHALEWVELVEETDNKLVLQHLLIMNHLPQVQKKAKDSSNQGVEEKKDPYGADKSDKAVSESKKDPSKSGRPPFRSPIIKHWRQDWVYQNRDFYLYDGDNYWKYVEKTSDEVEGQWTQKVFQVDDSPRYEGSATWVHVDGKSFWENSTDAPLPRRERTQRQDYNLMFRRNRVDITSVGWTHDQDNDKILRRSDQEDQLLAQEKGLNIYLRVDQERCKVAQTWWVQHQNKWGLVREEWANLFDRKQDIELLEQVDGKRLHEHLFPIEATAPQKTLSQSIQAFIKP
ncbi:MAG: hypothetical protein OXB93_07075 [Cytophagales bacterium]|nr:hypothetical protein [Cytophagales bacterium]